MRRIVFIAGSALTACTGGGGTSSGGSAIPQAVARYSAGAAPACASLPPFTLGQFSDANPDAARIVKSGDTENGAPVEIQCHVIPAPRGFEVSGNISVGGTTFHVAGSVDERGASSIALFELTTDKSWRTTSCRAEATGPFMGVSAGRYWGIFTCTDMRDTSAGGAGDACDVQAEVRLESCNTE